MFLVIPTLTKDPSRAKLKITFKKCLNIFSHMIRQRHRAYVKIMTAKEDRFEDTFVENWKGWRLHSVRSKKEFQKSPLWHIAVFYRGKKKKNEWKKKKKDRRRWNNNSIRTILETIECHRCGQVSLYITTIFSFMLKNLIWKIFS